MGPIWLVVYELSGMTLLVVERDERIRSEMVLDLFYQGGRVLVAGGVDEALDVMRVERLDCVLANPDLAPALKLLAGIDRSLAALPIVAMTPPPSVAKPAAVEA